MVTLTLKEKKRRKWNRVAFLLLTLSLCLLTCGVSTAFFEYVKSGNKVNTIETGQMVFTYSESNDAGSGIYIENAMPTSDEDGKNLRIANQYFDFQIYTNIISAPLEYQIVAAKQSNSTLPDDYVKIYLTRREGNYETPVEETTPNGEVILFSQLANTDYPGQTGKVIYRETVTNNKEYSKEYRLRMWVKEDVDVLDSNFSNKQFSIKINVYARSL